MKRKTICSIAITILFLTYNILPQKNIGFENDFLEFWTDVKENYAYFDKKHTDWRCVRDAFLPIAKEAKNKEELIPVFEAALEELYDNHFSLNTNLQSSTRLVPTGIDIWAAWINGKAVITEVRRGFSAGKAGVTAGMEIVSINGVPIEKAVLGRVGKCITKLDTEAKNYALLQLLAGTYLNQRVLVVNYHSKTTTISLDALEGNLTDNHRYGSLLESRTFEGNIGYIKFNNSLGQIDVIALFDSALDRLRRTRGLIIDLRETPSGGNSIVARAVLGRFITREMPYQKHILPNEEKDFKVKRSWLEIVSPRGEFAYDKSVVVLVNHWTGSMGEGIAIGFDALGKAKVVGTRMAGLNGAINGFETREAKIPYSFPTEQLYHINGTPREMFIPAFALDLSDPKYNAETDPVLAAGLRIINQRR